MQSVGKISFWGEVVLDIFNKTSRDKYNMLSSSLYAMLKLSKTTYPQNFFPSDSNTLYMDNSVVETVMLFYVFS